MKDITPTPAINLAFTHFEHVHGGIRVIGTWLTRGGQSDPCLVLLPARRVRGQREIPVVIPLADAWKWSMVGDMGDPEHVAACIEGWLDDGLLPGNSSNFADHMNIWNAVESRLRDMVLMPPKPIFGQRAIADVSIRFDTGETIETEVKADV